MQRHAMCIKSNAHVVSKVLMDDYQRQTKVNQDIKTLEDMQAFIERFPAFKAKSHNVEKHVALMSELSRLVEVPLNWLFTRTNCAAN